MSTVRAPLAEIPVSPVRTNLLSMKSVLAFAQKEAITVKAQIVQTGQLIDVSALQDSGAEANLIHWKTVQCL
jgi:hypothetical protein